MRFALPFVFASFALLFAAIWLGFGQSDVLAGRQLSIQTHLVPHLPTNGCEPRDQQAAVLEDNRLSTGFGKQPKVVWVKLADPAPDGRIAIYTDSVVDRAELFVCTNDAALTSRSVSGDMVPADARDIRRSEIVFSVAASELSEGVYLKFVQDASIWVAIKAMAFEDYLRWSSTTMAIRLFFFGALCIMVIYNLALAILTSHRAFAFNALVVISMIALDLYLSGVGAAYIWPSLGAFSNTVLAISMAGPSLFGPLYIWYFMKTDVSGAGYSFARFAIWPGLAVIALLSPLVVPHWMSLLALVLLWWAMGVFFIAWLGWLAWQGNERAGVLLVPLLGAAIPAMIAGVMVQFAGFDFGQFTVHQTEFALVLEAVLLTFALAYLLRLSERREIQALEELNRVSAATKQQLLSVIDDERTRIASDLHDTTGQGVVLLASRLKGLSGSKGLQSDVKDEISDISELARSLLSQIRQVAHELHPATLDHLGLPDAVKQLVESIAAATDIDIATQIEIRDDQVSRDQKLQVFRIVQELLSNVVKHASAATASVVVHADGRMGFIVVEDQGVGIPSDWRTEAGGLGMQILHERVRRLEGTLRFEQLDPGTRAEVRFPIT